MSETSPPGDRGRIVDLLLEREMQESYLNYSMSVIYSRALPDVRDGLKPSQRRILVAMNDLNLGPRAKYRKCAKICGDTSGNYHPHGESVVYPTLVGLAQPFTTRVPLVDSQGNFGAIDGSPPAAMRYTEARMSLASVHALEDLDKDTVAYRPNYDDRLREPEYLPSKFPNLLCNGSTGIAVGMATSLPPHNLREVAAAIRLLLDNPDVDVGEILQVLPGPDFPTGGVIMGRNGIRAAYQNGRGTIQVRGRFHVEEKGRRKQVVFTEVPFQVKVNTILERIAHLARTGQIDTISDVNDESSDRVGLRLVVELKRGVDDEQITVNQLFKLSPLQSTFSIINLAIDRGQPRTLGIKPLLEAYREHRFDVIRRRTRFLLRRAEERLHILEGLRIAVGNIDQVVEIIRSSRNTDEARVRLMERFELSEIQARSILDMRLRTLTGLEIEKLEAEYNEVKEKIAWYQRILAERPLVIDLIKKDLDEMVEAYGDDRRTEINEQEVQDFVDEDLIAEEMMVVTVSHQGYIKRTPLDQYRSQSRGGKGVQAGETKEGDFLYELFVASTHDYFLFFSDRGRVYWRKVYQLPQFSRTARGRALANVVQMQVEGERITNVLRVETFDDRFLVTATANGLIKKTPLEAYSRPKRAGIIAVGLEDDDRLIGVGLARAGQTIILGTAQGMAIRFVEDDVRSMGRSARGVRGIKVKESDTVVDMVITPEDRTLLTICENGYGKRTKVTDYRIQGRGGQGLIDIRASERNGDVVNLLSVADEDEIMMVTAEGQIVRTAVAGISVIGRNTQGVRCISLRDGDRLVSCAVVPSEDPSEDPSTADEPTQAGG
ncbi:MAG: DNA gyrase subunit A [Planctomycetota bacterium]